MAAPLTWPGRYHFYPIGNHSAQDLTRDLSPDQDANILLLPCGDPRNVSYTVFTETPFSTSHIILIDPAFSDFHLLLRVSVPRKVDFTCCDYDAGILGE